MTQRADPRTVDEQLAWLAEQIRTLQRASASTNTELSLVSTTVGAAIADAAAWCVPPAYLPITDAAETEYQLACYPVVEGSLDLKLRGVGCLLDTDYVIDYTTGVITLQAALTRAVGDWLTAEYQYIPGQSTPTPGPSVLFLDSFNRANAAALGTADTGQTWTDSGMTISSDKALAAGAGTCVELVDVGAELTYEGTVTPGTDGDAGLAFRGLTTTDCLYAQIDISPNRLVLGREPSGAILDSSTSVTFVVGTPYVITVRCEGTSVKVSVDGVELIDYTLAGAELTLVGATKIGLRSVNDGVSTFDDLSGVSL